MPGPEQNTPVVPTPEQEQSTPEAIIPEPEQSVPVAPAPGSEQNADDPGEEKGIYKLLAKFNRKRLIAAILAAVLVLSAVAGVGIWIHNASKSKLQLPMPPGGPAIAAGNITVGLHENGTVLVAGDSYGIYNVSNWKDIVQVETGVYCVFGLRSDGTVLCSGIPSAKVLSAPEEYQYDETAVGDWENIVSVSSGFYHTVGLKADGTVVSTPIIGDYKKYPAGGATEVSSWKNITAIAAGWYHTVGLKEDGTVISTKYTGKDGNKGQCEVSDWTDIIAVAAGVNHTVGLKADGTVVAVGNNEEGQCNVSDWTEIVAISANICGTVGLKADGTVVATEWLGAPEMYTGQNDVSDWTDIIAIAAGGVHTVGLKADGTVVATKFLKPTLDDGTSIEYTGQCDVEGWNLIGDGRPSRADATEESVGDGTSPTDATDPKESDAPEDAGTTAITGTVQVKGSLLIRSGPGKDYKQVGELLNGDRVTITEITTVDGVRWGRISDGWICLDYVQLDGETGTGAAEKPTVSESHAFKVGEYVNDRDMVTIQRINGNEMVFTVTWYRATGIDNVTAKIVGNTATFSYDNGYNTARGSLEVSGDKLTLTLTSTELPYIGPGTYVFYYFGTSEEWTISYLRNILLMNNDAGGWSQVDDPFEYIEDGGSFYESYFRFFENGSYTCWIANNINAPNPTYETRHGHYEIGDYMIYIDGCAYELFAQSTGVTLMELTALGKYPYDFSGKYLLITNDIYAELVQKQP